MWGVVPPLEPDHPSGYERMAPGDLVLFTGDNRLYATGTVTHLVRHEMLARELWGEDESGRTWELIYFLDDIRDRNISYSALNAAAGYQPTSSPAGSSFA